VECDVAAFVGHWAFASKTCRMPSPPIVAVRMRVHVHTYIEYIHTCVSIYAPEASHQHFRAASFYVLEVLPRLAG
jgi:hypothetical protein